MSEDTNQTSAAAAEDVEGHGVTTRRVSLQDDDIAARAAAPGIAHVTGEQDEDVQGHGVATRAVSLHEDDIAARAAAPGIATVTGEQDDDVQGHRTS